MSAPLRIHSDPATPTRHDAAGAWLDRVTAMLRVPAHERDAIRAELNEHLRERIRDLMLSGTGEAAATSQAISELGDAAMLARRYQEAIEPSSRRSLMHIGLATAATAALVFSGAALFQNGSPPNTPPAPPSGGNALLASAPAPTEREASQMRELERLSALLRDAQSALANQERDLARASGEVESLQVRTRAAEDRAAGALKESFEMQRQYMAMQEDLRRTREELDRVVRDRDVLQARLKQTQDAAAAVAPTGPVTYQPASNPAREFLRTLTIDTKDAATLGAIMAQPTIQNAKVFLRNEQLGAIRFNTSDSIMLPNRPITLGELIDIINSMGVPPTGLDARATPDDRIAIDLTDSFDRTGRALVIYDLSDIAQRERSRAIVGGTVSRVGAIEQLRQVITKTVTPELWQDNGGDLGAISVLDSSLIVTAPERCHHQIRWIIEQVRASGARSEAMADGDSATAQSQQLAKFEIAKLEAAKARSDQAGSDQAGGGSPFGGAASGAPGGGGPSPK